MDLNTPKENLANVTEFVESAHDHGSDSDSFT